MGRFFSLVALVAVGLLSNGCRTWGTVEGTTWSLKAPAKVAYGPGNKLAFTVETTTPEGKRVEGLSYDWIVEWVNLHGSNHKGKSFEEQSISVKGSPGTAYIRIYAYNKDQKLVEVAKQSVEVVEAPVAPPPAH